jgi:hypothetical protein
MLWQWQTTYQWATMQIKTTAWVAQAITTSVPWIRIACNMSLITTTTGFSFRWAIACSFTTKCSRYTVAGLSSLTRLFLTLLSFGFFASALFG